MATSLASTLVVAGTGLHGHPQLHSSLLYTPIIQPCLQHPCCLSRGASSCYSTSRRPLVLAAVGGSPSSSSSSSGPILESDKPSTSSIAEEREKAREIRWRTGLEEYEALKKDLSDTTIKVAVAVDAYIFLTLSPQTAVSYTIGAIASYVYLQLLYRHADTVSKDNVAEIFQKRRAKTIGIRSSDVQQVLEKTIRGCGISLSSPRLIVPAALYALWAFSTRFTGTSVDSFHLEVTPLMLGFFAYKAAALVQAYRDNKDLLFIIDSEDSDPR